MVPPDGRLGLGADVTEARVPTTIPGLRVAGAAGEEKKNEADA
jgi:hypothetical protein